MFEADRSQGSHRWPVVRLGANSVAEVVLLSSRFFALTTHWNKCTLPCCGDGCRLCELLPARGLFYLAAMSNSRVSIVELGSLSASHLEQHVKLLHGGLQPGLVVQLSRRGQKQPVRSEVLRTVEGAREVELLELAQRVLVLYKLPGANSDEKMGAYEERIRGICKVRTDRAADLLLNAWRRQVR